MKELLSQFEKINEKYQKRREGFRKIIQEFTSKGTVELRKKCQKLFDDSERLVEELKSDFLQTVEGRTPGPEIKSKIDELAKNLKLLRELTKSPWRQWLEAITVALVVALILRNFIFGLYHVPTGSAEPNILVGDRLWGNKMAYMFSTVKRGELVIFDNPIFKYDRSSSIKNFWQQYIGFPIPFLGLSSGPDNWVKRVIAIPGDVIEGRMEDGKTVVYRNGKKLVESYVNILPLISVKKTCGFIPWSRIGPLSIPGFLRMESRVNSYTYDPSKSFDQQPYYSVDDKNVIRNKKTKEPVLLYPLAPSYDHQILRNMDVFGPFVVPPGKYWVMGDSRRNSIDSRWWLFLDGSLIHGRASFVIYSIDSQESFWLFELLKHPIDFWRKSIRWSRFLKGLNAYGVNTCDIKK